MAEGEGGESTFKSDDADQEAFVDRIAGREESHRSTAPTAILQDRLAHLTQVEQVGGGALGRPADMKSNSVAAGGDPQLRKLQDISKTLEEIRKLYASTKTIGVKRRR
jgi:hypothetical protein